MEQINFPAFVDKCVGSRGEPALKLLVRRQATAWKI